MNPTVVMRSHNDAGVIRETLEKVRAQSLPCRLVNLDNASTDGTREIIQEYTDHLVEVPAGAYIPGRVLNLGMRESEGEFTVFLNSDCTPVDEFWLERLLEGFEGPEVAAVFGRQMPRPGCWLLHAKDTEDTYGDGRRQAAWRHCFSMASSAIRRSVWERMPFDEELRYSEDIDWTWRARQAGHRIVYAPESRVFHSHNYNLRQFYRRHRGEGEAEARIFEWPVWERSFLRYSLLPFARQVLSDWRYCLPRLAFGSMAFSPALRLAQMLGRRAGFRAGLAAGPRSLSPAPPRDSDRRAA